MKITKDETWYSRCKAEDLRKRHNMYNISHFVKNNISISWWESVMGVSIYIHFRRVSGPTVNSSIPLHIPKKYHRNLPDPILASLISSQTRSHNHIITPQMLSTFAFLCLYIRRMADHWLWLDIRLKRYIRGTTMNNDKGWRNEEEGTSYKI